MSIKLTKAQEKLFNAITTRRQQLTAINYIAGGYNSMTNAYLAACEELEITPADNANVAASTALSHAKVQAFIDSVKIVAAKSVNFNAAWLMARHIEIDSLDCLDLLNDDATLKPVSQWPKSWRVSISGMSIKEMVSGEGDVSMLKGVKWPDKVKNLDSIRALIETAEMKAKASNDDTAVNSPVLLIPTPVAQSDTNEDEDAKYMAEQQQLLKGLSQNGST